MKKRNKKDLKKELESKNIFIHDDHKLVTRRDFLSAGLIQFSAMVMAPTLLSALLKSNSAYADCAASSGTTNTLMPFIHLNLAGGASLASNFIPRDQGGNLLTNMNLMGLSTANNLVTNNRLVSDFGIQNGFHSQSGLLAGLRAVAATAGILPAAANYINNTALIGVPVRSGDDSSMNPGSLRALVTNAGLQGSALPILTSSGFGQVSSIVPPQSSPLIVTRATDLDNAVGVPAPLGTMTKSRQVATFKLLKSLSEAEAVRLLASAVNAPEVQEATGCATSQNQALVAQNKPATTPVANAELMRIWNLTATNGVLNNPTSQNSIFGSVVFNALIEQAGYSELQMGGYDYHNNTRTSGNTRDNDAGQVIGRILQSAAVLNQDVTVMVTSDGSTRSMLSDTDDQAVWVSDRGQAGQVLLFIYKANGRPTLGNSQIAAGSFLNNQIGHFTSGQSADSAYLPNWDVNRAMLAIFANYLKLNLGNSWQATYNAVVEPARIQAGFGAPPLDAVGLAKILRT
jgi:hypothetical protein